MATHSKTIARVTEQLLPATVSQSAAKTSAREATAALSEAATFALGDAVLVDTVELARGRLSTYDFLERGALRLAPPAPDTPPPSPPSSPPPDMANASIVATEVKDAPGADDGRVGSWRRTDVIVASFFGVLFVFLSVYAARILRKRYRHRRRMRKHADASKLGSGETSDEDEEERDLLHKPGRRRAAGDHVSSGGVVVGDRGGGDDDDDEEDLAKLTSAPPADADASLSGPTEPPRSLLRWDAASNTWVTLASAADGSELSAEIDVSASTKAKAPPPATADGKGLASIAEGDEEMSRATSPADTRLKSSRAATAAAGGGAKERRLKAKKKKRPMDPAHLDARRRLADPDSWFVPGADEPQSGMGVARHAPAPAPPPLLPPSGVGGSRPRPLAPYLRQSAALAAQPEELRRVEDSVPLDDILPAMQGFDLEIDADAVGGEPLSSPPPRDLEAFPAGGQAGGSIDDALGQHWQMSTNHDESPPPAEEVSPYMMRDNALFDDDELEMTREEGEEESNNEDSGASTSAPPPPPFPWMQQQQQQQQEEEEEEEEELLFLRGVP